MIVAQNSWKSFDAIGFNSPMAESHFSEDIIGRNIRWGCLIPSASVQRGRDSFPADLLLGYRPRVLGF